MCICEERKVTHLLFWRMTESLNLPVFDWVWWQKIGEEHLASTVCGDECVDDNIHAPTGTSASTRLFPETRISIRRYLEVLLSQGMSIYISVPLNVCVSYIFI